MKEYILAIGVTWLLRTAIDLGVKYSKSTENTLDDIIFLNLQHAINSLTKKKK